MTFWLIYVHLELIPDFDHPVSFHNQNIITSYVSIHNFHYRTWYPVVTELIIKHCAGAIIVYQILTGLLTSEARTSGYRRKFRR